MFRGAAPPAVVFVQLHALLAQKMLEAMLDGQQAGPRPAHSKKKTLPHRARQHVPEPQVGKCECLPGEAPASRKCLEMDNSRSCQMAAFVVGLGSRGRWTM